MRSRRQEADSVLRRPAPYRAARLAGLLVVFSVLLAANPGWACRCPMDGEESVREWVGREYDRAFAVFEGEVESLETHIEPVQPNPAELTSERIISLRVLRAYKGSREERLMVHTSLSSCGFDFEIGKRYLVYALGTSIHKLSSYKCTRTALLERAASDLRFLRGEPPTEEDVLPQKELWKRLEQRRRESRGTLCGQVYRADGSLLTGANVYLLRVGKEPRDRPPAWVEASADGRYRVEMLDAGRYLLSAVDTNADGSERYIGVFGSATTLAGAQAVEVKPGAEGCGLNIVLYRQPLYHVRGRLQSSAGSPLVVQDGKSVISTARGDSFPFTQQVEVHPDGTFEFLNVPAGSFFLQARYMDRDGKVRFSVSARVAVHVNLEVLILPVPRANR